MDAIEEHFSSHTLLWSANCFFCALQYNTGHVQDCILNTRVVAKYLYWHTIRTGKQLRTGLWLYNWSVGI